MATQTISSAELARTRAKLYEFMSVQYLRPLEPDFLKFLAEWVSLQVEPGGLGEWLSERMRNGLAALDEFFKNQGGKSWEELAEAISVDFVRLFRGVKEHYSPPPPYESVYREEAGRVFGDATMAVLKEYRRFGYDLAFELKNEPPDHISFELEFMSILCSREAEAWEKADDDDALYLRGAQREFSSGHLLTWLPELCRKVDESDRAGFFSGLARFTEGWVAFDFEHHIDIP